jgi:hypothetical protein
VVMQALLVDPIVSSVRAAERMLDTTLMLQEPYLGYITQECGHRAPTHTVMDHYSACALLVFYQPGMV